MLILRHGVGRSVLVLFAVACGALASDGTGSSGPTVSPLPIGFQVDAVIGGKHANMLKPENFIDYASLPQRAQEVILSAVKRTERLVVAYANREYLDEYAELKLVQGAKLIEVVIDSEAESYFASQDEFKKLRPEMEKQAASNDFERNVNEGLSPQLRERIKVGAPVRVDSVGINERAFAILFLGKVSKRDVISDDYLILTSAGFLRLNDRLVSVRIYVPFFGPESIAELRAFTVTYLGNVTSINH